MLTNFIYPFFLVHLHHEFFPTFYFFHVLRPLDMRDSKAHNMMTFHKVLKD